MPMVNAMPGVRIISEPIMAWLAEVPSRLQPRMHASVMSAAQLILQSRRQVVPAAQQQIPAGKKACQCRR